MERFAVKGIFVDTPTPDTLRVRDGYMLCEDGRCGAFREAAPAGVPVYDHSGQIITPGFVDLHLHAPQYSYCGTAMDLELLDWLQQTLCPGGVWNRTRVVIFTEYMDTQHYLAELLNKSGMGGERLICLNGATSAQERERFKAAFQAAPDTSPVRILLGTDAASEGINLQNHCSERVWKLIYQ